MKAFQGRILANRAVADSWRELVLSWEPEAGRPRPGQFLTLRVSPRYDPLLRRPFAFSAAAADGSSVSLVYQLRGSATRLLAELAPGSPIDLLGPLGKAFPEPGEGVAPLIVGGGIGLGPVLFLARELGRGAGTGGGIAGGRTAPLLALGFRNAASVPDLELPPGTLICTDDGSAGFRGTPLDYIARNAKVGAARAYGCGPPAMLAALAALAAERGWAASLSAEQWMACGVGACMGCVLPRPGGAGFLRACADGPVFEAGEIDWAAEAARASARAAACGGGARGAQEGRDA